MKHLYKYLLSLILWIPLIGTAQITTNPQIPVATESVSIFFDSSKDSKLGKFTGELYAHTGVIIEGKTEWQHIIGDWGQNTIQPKLTAKGDGIYQLDITPNINTFYSVPSEEKVIKMAFVFRSADGSQQTNDIFVEVYESGINVSFASPQEGLIISKDQSLNVIVNASANETIQLLLDGTEVKTVSSQQLSHNISNHTAGTHTLKAIASKESDTKEATRSYFVKGDVVSAPQPAGTKKGINYNSDQSTTLVLYAPGKDYVYVLGDFNNWEINEDYQMKKDDDNFWITLSGLTPGKEYIFQYLIDGDIRIADPYTEKVSDPWNDKDIPSTTYPNLIAYPNGKTTHIASVLQTAQGAFSWADASFTAPAREDLVIYELLIRDFTSQGDIKSAMAKLDYLETLGVNAIELMPFNEFEGNSSWGYNPSFYFAPDKAYGTKQDYKNFINECHKRGIAVIMDMVLNHSFGQSPLVRMYFDGSKPTVDNPWYNRDYNFQNTQAQWGYDFNHESTQTQQLVDSINSFWMSQYHIDGFRFDFTKGFSNTQYGPSSWGSDYDQDRIDILKRMSSQIWKRKEKAIVIFEHLAVNEEEKVLATHNILLWGNANGNYNEATMGWNESGKSDFSWASWKGKGWDRPGLISYMESHDEERLMFKNLKYGNSSGSYSVKNLNTALARMEMATAFYLTVPGPKMIWQFGELGYDKSIDENGRTGEKPVHWEYLDNDNRKRLYQVNAALANLKQDQPAFLSHNFTITAGEPLKRIEINHSDMDVRIIGNFDVTAGTISPNFSSAGTWYDYFSGAEVNITDPSAQVELKPGEYHIYTNKKLDKPDVIELIPTGIDDNIETTDIRIYPNPVANQLHLDNIGDIKTIKLFSLTGRQIIIVQPQRENETINMSNLPAGFYLLSMEMHNGKRLSQKIIKK